MKISHRFIVAAACFIILIPLLISCEGESTEDEARAIYEKAIALRQAGRELEGLKLMDTLTGYKDTKVYNEAKEALLKEGLSVGNALSSWTLKKMYDIKNERIRSGMLWHPNGDARIKLGLRDAWGERYHLQYSKKPKIYFSIWSAGPDKLWDTGDDMAVYYRDTSTKKSRMSDAAKQFDEKRVKPKETAKKSFSSGKVSAKPKAAEKKSPTNQRSGEKTLGLDELLKEK